MLTEKSWKLDAVLMLGSGLLLSLGGGMILGQTLLRMYPGLSKSGQTFLGVLVGTLSFQGAALAWLHVFLRKHQRGWREFLGASSPQLRRSLQWALWIGTISVPFAWLLNGFCAKTLEWLGHAPEEQAMVQMLQAHSTFAQRLCSGALAIVLAPVAEESLFRGVLYPTVKELGYPRLALWGTSALFAAVHLNWMTLVPLFALSVLLVRLYEDTDTLLAPILAHGLFNAVNYVQLIVAVERWPDVSPAA